MAVAVEDDATIKKTAATYTAASGSNRLLVVLIGTEDVSVLTSVVFGGETMVESQAFAENQTANVFAYHILDTNIPSGSQTLVITETGSSWSTDEWAGHIYTLTGVDQTTPIGNKTTDNEGAATTWTSTSITSVDDGILLTQGTSISPIDAGSSITTASWTTNAIHNPGGGGQMSGHKLITTGVSEGVVLDWNGGSETGVSMLMSVLPSTADPIIITIPTGPWY